MISWHRFYDPEIGRYISADPIGLAGGINLYAYVQNDSINKIDQRGLSSEGHCGLLPPHPGINTIVCNDNEIGIQTAPRDENEANPCYQGCVRNHETIHKKDCDKVAPGICLGQPDGTVVGLEDGTFLNDSECRAYKEELACMKKKLEEDECGQCKAALKSKINLIETEKIPKHCRI